MKYLLISILVLSSFVFCAKQKSKENQEGQTPAETTMTAPPSTTMAVPDSTRGDSAAYNPGDTMRHDTTGR